MLAFVSGVYLTASLNVCVTYGALSPPPWFSESQWNVTVLRTAGFKEQPRCCPRQANKGLCVPLFGGKRPTRDVPAAPPGFPNPFQTLLHSASFINWIICFLSLLLSKSNQPKSVLSLELGLKLPICWTGHLPGMIFSDRTHDNAAIHDCLSAKEAEGWIVR